jgi:hypothetical protein
MHFGPFVTEMSRQLYAKCGSNLAHGLLLWRQTRNQVFQDDIRERKGEEGKDIGDLHRCPIDNPPAAESSSSVQCAICRT